MLANSHVTWEGGCYIGGILLTTTEDTDRWWEEYFEVLLNPTETSSVMDVEPLDEGDDSPITGGGRYLGVGEIDPEFLKTLDVVGLSWLTPLEDDDGALDWQSWRFQTSVAEL